MDLVLFTQLSDIIPVSQGINRTFQTLAIGVPRTAARSLVPNLIFKVGQRQIIIFTPDISIRSDSVNLGCKFVLFVTCTEVY